MGITHSLTRTFARGRGAHSAVHSPERRRPCRQNKLLPGFVRYVLAEKRWDQGQAIAHSVSTFFRHETAVRVFGGKFSHGAPMAKPPKQLGSALAHPPTENGGTYGGAKFNAP